MHLPWVAKTDQAPAVSAARVDGLPQGPQSPFAWVLSSGQVITSDGGHLEKEELYSGFCSNERLSSLQQDSLPPYEGAAEDPEAFFLP